MNALYRVVNINSAKASGAICLYLSYYKVRCVVI